jgi:hypothetical protein
MKPKQIGFLLHPQIVTRTEVQMSIRAKLMLQAAELRSLNDFMKRRMQKPGCKVTTEESQTMEHVSREWTLKLSRTLVWIGNVSLAYQQQRFQQQAHSEEQEWVRRSQYTVGVAQKYPRPADSAKNLYDYYAYEADQNGKLAAQYEKLAQQAPQSASNH